MAEHEHQIRAKEDEAASLDQEAQKLEQSMESAMTLSGDVKLATDNNDDVINDVVDEYMADYR